MEILIPKPGSWYINAAASNASAKITGPFHDDGEPWQRIELPTRDLNTFRQGLRLLDETSVFHQKIGGNIFVVPGLKNAKYVGKETKSGYSLYEVKAVWRSGGSSFPTTITSTLELIFTGSESFGRSDSSLLHAYYSTRMNERTFLTNYVYSFASGAWGNRWAFDSTAITVWDIYPDSCRFSQTSHTPSSQTEDDMPRGSLTVGGGIAAAKSSIIRRDALMIRVEHASKIFLPEVDFSMSNVRTWMNRLLSPELFDSLPSLKVENWGELSHQATENLDLLSSNMLEFILELRKIKTLVPKLKNLKKVKTHASNYLGMKYGILPTISDLESIFNAFKANRYYDQHGLTRVSAYDKVDSSISLLGQQVPIYHTRRIHLAINEMDTGLDSLVEKARNIGVFPSLGNIWDLVPFSFVIDWFVDVGSVLERIDTHHRLFNLDIPYVIKSDKIETSVLIVDPKVGAGANLSISRYNRQVTTEVPQPRIFGDVVKPPTVQNHWIEGSALILSRTK